MMDDKMNETTANTKAATGKQTNAPAMMREVLTKDVAGATIGGVRSPLTNYPSDGLTPARLANILRAADAGDAVQYLELAETIEERDPHYLGVLGTRRRSVSQIEVTVDAASEDPLDEEIAAIVRTWLGRGELTQELFNILDCLGKGYSVTEIIWKNPNGVWEPDRLEPRDPRWFRFARHDLTTPLRLNDVGQEEPLEFGKFIFAAIPAKSGIPIRSGLARVAIWGWLFKAYTLRDWAIFCQTYGQPVRVGKFDTNASEEDKATLFRAVSNIAGDCAAIIPRSMEIEFIESSSVGSSSDMYERRADWFDKQISKAVLGQTATTDAVVGGLGSGKEHRAVQKDIETADARALAAILNRDLIVPWIELRWPGHGRYPRLKLQSPEQEDLKSLAEALAPLIDRGLEVEQSVIWGRFGLSEPKAGSKLLRPERAEAGAGGQVDPNSKIKEVLGEIKRGNDDLRATTALQAEGPVAAKKTGGSVGEVMADRMAVETAKPIEAMLAKIEAMFDAASTLEELREMILAGFPDLDSTALSQVIALGLVAANAGGRVAVADET
jgi:phage gp29-like protein